MSALNQTNYIFEVLGIKMKFEIKLRNYISSKEQKYFVRTTRLFCQANQ